MHERRIVTARHNSNKLLDACKTGDLTLLKTCLADNKFSASFRENAPLCLAVENNHLKVVEFLLTQPNVKADARENQPLCVAAARGYDAILAILLKHIPDSPSIHKAFLAACQNKQVNAASILINSYPKYLDYNNFSVFRAAVDSNDI